MTGYRGRGLAAKLFDILIRGSSPGESLHFYR